MLCDAAIVTYDQEDDEVDLGPAAERVEPAVFQALSDEIGELVHAEATKYGEGLMSKRSSS